MSGYTDTPTHTVLPARGPRKNMGSGAFAASESMEALLKDDENLSGLSREELVSFCRRLKGELEWQEQHEQDSLNAQKADHAATVRKTEECAAAEIEAQEAKIEKLKSTNKALTDDNIELNKLKKDFEDNWVAHEDDTNAAILERDRVLKQLHELKAKLSSTQDDCTAWKSELEQQAGLTQKANEKIRQMNRAAHDEAEKYHQQEVVLASLREEVKEHQMIASELQKRIDVQTTSTNTDLANSEPNYGVLPQSEKRQDHAKEDHGLSLSAELPSSTSAESDEQLGYSADYDDSGFFEDSFGYVSVKEAMPIDAVQDLGACMDVGLSRRSSLSSSMGSPATTLDNLLSKDATSTLAEGRSCHPLEVQHDAQQPAGSSYGTSPVVESYTRNSGTSSIGHQNMANFASVSKFLSAWVWTTQAVIFIVMVFAIIAEAYQYRQWTNANGVSRAMFLAAEDEPWCVRIPRADYAWTLISPSGLPRW